MLPHNIRKILLYIELKPLEPRGFDKEVHMDPVTGVPINCCVDGSAYLYMQIAIN